MLEDTEVQFQPLLDDDILDDLEKDTDVILLGSQQPAILQRRRRRRRWLTTVSIVMLVVLAGGGALFYWQFTRPTPVQYIQSQITSGNLSVKISATGPVNANAVYNLNFSTTGQVREIDVQIGQKVKSGQVLAKINVDVSSLQDSLAQAQLGVTSAQHSLNSAQASFANTQSSLYRSQSSNAAALKVAQDQEQTDLNNCNNQSSSSTNSSAQSTPTISNNSSQSNASCIQTAKDKFAQAQNQLNASNVNAGTSVTSSWNQVVNAQDGIDKANLQLQSAQRALDNANANTNLLAPADGTIANINGVTGQNVSSGSSSSSQGFIVLTDTSKLSIAALVNEADIGSVQAGQPAQFSLSAYPGSTFRATVTAIETVGQTTQNVVGYTVLLSVDQSSLGTQHIYPGMTATVNITTAQRIGTLLIPSAALSFPTVALQNGEITRAALAAVTGSSGQSNTLTKSRVVLVLTNGKLTPVMITTGLSSGQFTEVVSGLNEGDMVVTSQTGGSSSTTTSGRTTGGTTGGGNFGGGNFGGGVSSGRGG